jgi:hypothetical protein
MKKNVEFLSSGEALAENTTMRSIDLSWNSINGKGAVALIKGIQVIIIKILII